MNIGIRLHDTRPGGLRERLASAAAQGFSCVQLAMSKAVPGFRMDEAPRLLTKELAGEVRRELERANMECAVLGCYLKLACQREEEARRVRDIYLAHLNFAAWIGARCVGTETPPADGPEGEACRSEAHYRLLLERLFPVVRAAEQRGVTLAVEVENLTVVNDAGDGRIAGQAVAVYAAGDRTVFRGCSLLAHQDTLFCGPIRLPNAEADIGERTGSAERAFRAEDGPLTHSRQYYENCLIRGDVDFIFGPYRCWFEGCTLIMNARGGWYTAANTNENQPFGFVFHRCRLTGDCAPGAGFLGRPWRKYARTLFLACEMDEHVAPEGFSDWDEERVITDRCGEWRTTGIRADQSTRHPAQKRLTDEEAKEITLSRILGGADQWRPAREQP